MLELQQQNKNIEKIVVFTSKLRKPHSQLYVLKFTQCSDFSSLAVLHVCIILPVTAVSHHKSGWFYSCCSHVSSEQIIELSANPSCCCMSNFLCCQRGRQFRGMLAVASWRGQRCNITFPFHGLLHLCCMETIFNSCILRIRSEYFYANYIKRGFRSLYTL